MQRKGNTIKKGWENGREWEKTRKEKEKKKRERRRQKEKKMIWNKRENK